MSMREGAVGGLPGIMNAEARDLPLKGCFGTVHSCNIACSCIKYKG